MTKRQNNFRCYFETSAINMLSNLINTLFCDKIMVVILFILTQVVE